MIDFVSRERNDLLGFEWVLSLTQLVNPTKNIYVVDSIDNIEISDAFALLRKTCFPQICNLRMYT